MGRLFEYKKFTNSSEIVDNKTKISKKLDIQTKSNHNKNTKILVDKVYPTTIISSEFCRKNYKKNIKDNRKYCNKKKFPITITKDNISCKTATAPTNKVNNRKKTKSKIYGFMKEFLRKNFNTTTQNNNNNNNTKDENSTTRTTINSRTKIFSFIKNSTGNNKLKLSHEEENFYVKLPPATPLSLSASNCLKVINNNLHTTKDNKKTISIDNHIKRFDVMQDVRIRIEHQQKHGSPTHNNTTNNLQQQNHNHQQQQQNNQNQNLQMNLQQNHNHNHQHQRRPIHLFPQTANLNGNENEHIPHSPSSEEDNSPTEMNNCRRLVDKPPLVKRLTMGLFGSTEDSRPLVNNTSTSLNNCGSNQTISDGYVNEGICEPSEKIISSKFGDSCRQSLTAIPNLETHHFLDNSEFNFKKKYLRETSSANSSPKIFPPSALLKNKGSLSPSEQSELKGAAWFQAGISREISVEILTSQSPGAFLVRQSNTKGDCFVLSVRVPPPAPKVAHYLILRTIRGYKIKGFTKEFTSLRALITHHSVMPELLPVPLSLPRPNHGTPRRRNMDDFESYGSLRLLGILNMLQSKHNMDNHNS